MPKDVVQENSLQASASPVQEDVRELLSPSDQTPEAVDTQDQAIGVNDGMTSQAEPVSGLSQLTNKQAEEAKSEEQGKPLKEAIEQDYDVDVHDDVNLQDQHASASTPFVDEEALEQVSSEEGKALEEAIEGLDVASPPATDENDPSLNEQHLLSKDISTSPALSPSRSTIDPIPKESAVPSPKRPEASPSKTITPSSTRSRRSLPRQQLSDVLSPEGSPQIGASLLRRESLRRRESPAQQRELRNSKTPKKRNTLSRRDTLQEREILQKVIAETSQDKEQEEVDNQALDPSTTSRSKDNVQLGGVSMVNEGAEPESATNEPPSALYDSSNAEPSSPTLDAANVEQDLHRAQDAIEMYEEPVQADVDPQVDLIDDPEQIKAIDTANEVIAESELEQAIKKVETAKQQEDPPLRKTRSGARFSDDTNMLRDFLNRAQASKAAKTPILSPLDAPKPQTSPRRSPRKALGSHKGPAKSPQNIGDVANRPGTPPGISKVDVDSDEAEENAATPTSCRRSTRTRLPAPSKPPPGAPSFIPVRRADGTDPVVLQKSQAQELAMVTRANTRRNKGQSKPPLLALKDLPADLAEETNMMRQRANNEKSVGWAETLASYQDSKEKSEDLEEIKPKVRRMRGLGATNGTPAPKKTTAVVATSNGTPAPKRRSKNR